MVAVAVLPGCQSAGFGADVFNFDKSQQGGFSQIVKMPDAVTSFSQQAVLPVSRYGVISSARDLNVLMGKIPDRENYDTVVLMAATDHKGQSAATAEAEATAEPEAESFKQNIFTYGDAGVLADKKINFDGGLAKKMADTNFLTDLGSIKKGSYWSSDLLSSVSEKFPHARILPLSINRNLTSEKTRVFSYVLKSNLPARSLVIALADFEKPTSDFVVDFENGFIKDVLVSLDRDKMDELPGKDTAVLLVLADYLQSIGAVKIEETGTQGWQAVYGKGERKDPGRIYMVAFGDIMLGRQVRTRMNANGMNYPFENMDQNYLKVNDLLIANLEGPVAKNAIKTSKAIAFRFMPDVVPLLKKHYFDIVSLANNHAYDMGFQGYKDSKELLNAGGMLPFGDARGLNDDSVAKVMVRGKKIAFIGLEEVVYKIDDDAAVKKIKELVKEGYLVIPFVHMGTEYVHKPISRQKELYHKLIDAGAAMVIGHHPHVVEGYEKYNGRLIFYSLGNAVFDQDWSYDTQEGLSIALMIEGGATVNDGLAGGEPATPNPRVNVWLMPIKIDKSSMRLMDADERKTFFDKYAEWSDISGQEKESVLSGMIRI